MLMLSLIHIYTNFLLDCVLPGRPEHAAAQTIKGLVDVGLIEGVVSACSLKDVYYILTKQTGEARAREVVRDCLKSYSVEPLDQEACFTSAYSDEPDFCLLYTSSNNQRPAKHVAGLHCSR